MTEPRHAKPDMGIEWPEFPPPYRPGRHRANIQEEREARRRELHEAEVAIGLHSDSSKVRRK